MKTIFFSLTACVVAACAQPQPSTLQILPLKGGIYWVKGGSGANTGLIVGANEVVLIDAKMTAESCRAVVAEIGKLTPKPVKRVILTHSDGDHVNGLAGLSPGVTVIGHPNAKRDMEEAFKDPKLAGLLPYIPGETTTGGTPLKMDGVRANLLYFGPAHTSGDLVVYCPDQKIAFVGDLMFVGRDPLIHRQKGGTSFGLVQALDRILSLDADIFISGHADPLTKQDVRALLASIRDKQAKAKSLIEQGKTLQEIKSAFGIADTGAAAGRRFPTFIEVIYADLTDKR